MQDLEIPKQALKKAIRNKDVKFLAKVQYGYDLTKGQEYIVGRIVRSILERLKLKEKYKHKNKYSISCHTRYGKTFCVTLAIAIVIDMGIRVKIAFIGPRDEQAGILREHMAEHILRNPSLLKKAQLKVEGAQKIQKEASRKRMTFNTMSEYRVFTAEGEADRLMGFGVDIKGTIGIIVKDEAILINRTACIKIGRMMGSNPDGCIFIELMNPWERDNIAFEHTLDPEFEFIHVDWRQGVKEGRTTKKYVMDQKKELTPLEFEVLWESNFPEESEDSVYNLKKITEAEEKNFGFKEEIDELIERLKKEPRNKDHILQDLKKYKMIVSCDPADKGMDETVILWGIQKGNKFEVLGEYHEPKSDNMEIVGRMYAKAHEITPKELVCYLKIDQIGLGVGALSRMAERAKEPSNKNIEVVGCHFGERAAISNRFTNKKAENYFRNRDMFNEDLISIPTVQKLKSQLVAMKWGRSSTEKIKIFDPGEKLGERKTDIKSPDYADALVYFTWGYESKMIFGSFA